MTANGAREEYVNVRLGFSKVWVRAVRLRGGRKSFGACCYLLSLFMVLEQTKRTRRRTR